MMTACSRRASARLLQLRDVIPWPRSAYAAAVYREWTPSYHYGGEAAAVVAAPRFEQQAAAASMLRSRPLYTSTAASLLVAQRPAEVEQSGSMAAGGILAEPASASASAGCSCTHAHVTPTEAASAPGGAAAPGRTAAPGGAAASHSCAVPTVTGTWLDRLPQPWVPYAQLMRLDKPIGTWLLAWPCFWSICLAAPHGSSPDLRLLTLFGLGAVLLRGAGCTMNDLWDRELDKQVERTRRRPLVVGTVTPGQAVAFLGVQLSAGLAILLLLNPYSQLLGASSLTLVATYPIMKRITGWPQAFLGLTFNWGALLGWAAVHGRCDWGVVLPLYASGVCWTLVYDTIYAHQDKADDVNAGIRSTALTFGAHTKRYCAGFGAASVALLALTGHMAGCGAAYYVGVAAAVGHLAWQIGSVDLASGSDCSAKFVSNTQLGALVCAGILADRLQLLAC